jgi:putative acetyltransferase
MQKNMMNYKIRFIEARDNLGVKNLIQTVMPEFGATGPGFAIHDPEVSDMFTVYHRAGHAYFVVTDAVEEILGGGGIAPLAGANGEICELRKMYFKAEIRGLGLGQALMDQCLSKARQMGYKQCYLETLKLMQGAQKLYLKNDFKPLSKPMGETGHFSCDSFYLRKLY